MLRSKTAGEGRTGRHCSDKPTKNSGRAKRRVLLLVVTVRMRLRRKDLEMVLVAYRYLCTWGVR